MRVDTYTKAVFTVIAIMLSVIALRPIVGPETTAQAQGGFAGLVTAGPWEFFDTRTGDYWVYYNTGGRLADHYKMTKPGAPLIEVK